MQVNNPIKLYLNGLAASGRRSCYSQLNTVRQVLNWPKPLEEQPFHLLSYSQLEMLKVQMLNQGQARKTINRAIQLIKGIVNAAYSLELISHKDLMRIKSVKSVKNQSSDKGQALSPENINKLLKEMKMKSDWVGIRDLAIFTMLLSTGIRRTELCNLELADYISEVGQILIRSGKGGKFRRQFLPKWSISSIEQWLRIRGSNQGPLFLARGCFKGLSSDALYRLVVKRTKTILNRRYTPHDLRRTYITELLNSGADVLTVSRMAGHANVSTTQLYDKRGIEAQIQAAQALDFSRGE